MSSTQKKLISALASPVTLSHRETVLGCIACGCAAAACLMTGLVVGMLISPRKNVTIGSNNGGNVVDKRTISDIQEDEECVQF